MATGPEHYQRAEELLAEISRDDGSVDFGEGGEAYALAAIGHGLLALAAAAGLNDIEGGKPASDHLAWIRVAGVKGGSDR